MSCQKLSRQSLHIVSTAGLGWYSLANIGISRLFYPSKEEAKAKGNGSNVPEALGSFSRVPEPSIHYQPLRSPATASTCADRRKDVFALFGNSSILCSDGGGYVTMFNTETQSYFGMPPMNSPKGPHYIAVSIPSTAPHASSVYANKLCNGSHTDSLYIMDMIPGKPCSFEVLAYNPVKHWCWCPLPQPPFSHNPEYSVPDVISFAVVGGTRICVSSDTATLLL